jgi:uncharacterized protein involved in exopolysaccharide biosynthesis
MSDAQGFDEEAEGGSSGGLQVDLIKSYAAFGWRAVRQRWGLVATVFVVGVVLSALLAKFVPRTYSCKTVLMAVNNPVLDGANLPNPLAGAASSIMRRENLENLVRDTGLLQKAPVRRPPLLHLKDQVIEGLFGKATEEVRLTVLAATLETKLWVEIDQSGNLAINADWSDPKTAAELAEGAREGFVKTRHAAEVSAFEAKMAILDEHASKMRAEIETLAQQINSAHEERAAIASKGSGAGAAPTPAAAPAVRLAAPRASAGKVAVQVGIPLPELKEKLSERKRKLAELEAERDRRMRDEQAKLAELKLHLTPSHPQVVLQQERVAMASQVSSDASLLRSEIADLEANVKQREAVVAHAATGTGTGFSTASAAGTTGAGGGQPLPQEIVSALENDNTDPALSTQLSGAVMRYGQLRDEIRAGRMQLDTAQAAFDHRYQIVVPADVPSKPTKPKPLLLLLGGLILSLLLSVLLPILAQLKRGIMIESWQAHHIPLPVLAELQLPPHSTD